MKRLIVCVVLALPMMAQNAKVEPPKGAPQPTVKPERPLNETELLKIRLDIQKVKLLRDKYKIEEFQKEVQPISDEQNSIYSTACESVGIPKEKVQTECQIITGYDNDDKPVLGPDGKPIPPSVTWIKPAEKK